MKKVLSLVLGLGMFFTVAACGGGEKEGKPSKFASEVTAETYSVYSLEVEAGATYKAYDPDGNEIGMLNGTFTIRGEGEYYYGKTVKGKTTYVKVVAKDTRAPELRLSYSKKYARKDEAVALPAVEVIESDGTKDVEITVTSGESVVTVTDGTITPAELGEYVVTATSTDKSGNKATERATIVCTDNEYALTTVYEFNSVWGMENQTAQRMGIRMETTEELAPNGEVVCKLNMTTPAYYSSSTSVRKHEMYLINPMHVNWADTYSKLYFWVNNQTEYGYYVRFIGLQIYVAPGSGWTKIEFSDFDLLGAEGAAYEGIIDPEDCEGVYLCFQRNVAEFQFGTFYVSNIYGEVKAEEAAGGEQQ